MSIQVAISGVSGEEYSFEADVYSVSDKVVSFTKDTKGSRILRIFFAQNIEQVVIEGPPEEEVEEDGTVREDDVPALRSLNSD